MTPIDKINKHLDHWQKIDDAATPGPWIRLGDSGLNKTSGYNSYLWYRDDFRSCGVPDQKICEVLGYEHEKTKDIALQKGLSVTIPDDARAHNIRFIAFTRNASPVHREVIRKCVERLCSIERRAGSASRQSGYTDATEVAAWAEQTLAEILEMLEGVKE